MTSSVIKFKVARGLQNLINSFLEFLETSFWPGTRPSKEIRKICVYRVGQVGDMICSVPALYAIRKAYPEAHFTLLSTTANKEKSGALQLLEGASWIDRLWIYDPFDLRSLKGFLRFRKSLRGERFDIWLELPQDFSTFTRLLRNLLYVKTLGIRWSRGYRLNNLRLFGREQAEYRVTVGEVERLLNYVAEWGIPAKDCLFPFPISLNDRAFVKELFKRYQLKSGEVLAIAPGGKRSTNLWPVARFTEIARRWVGNGGQAIIIGGPSDYASGESIKSGGNGAIVNLCGQTSLLQAIELLSRCHIFVGNDSGPVHMAAAVGIPCVVAYTASQLPWHWAPWGKNHRLIRKAVRCSPCFLTECPENNLCLTEVSVDEVWNAVQETIAARSLLPS